AAGAEARAGGGQKTGGASLAPLPAPRRFKIGKYDVVAQPAPGSSHMLRYTVLLQGQRLGAQMSVPCESDCRLMESPPAVPPLKIFSVTYPPGRPRKGTVRPAWE